MSSMRGFSLAVMAALVLGPAAQAAEPSGLAHARLPEQRQMARGAAPVSYLGIDVRAVGDDQVTTLRLKDIHGAEITQVDHDAPAGKMDLRVHDVVLQMNGILIDTADQLRRMMHDCPPGRMVVMTINREGQVITTSAPMADREVVERQAWAQHVGTGINLPGPQAPDSALPTPGETAFAAPAPAPAAPGSRYSKSFLGTLLTSPTYTGAMLEIMRPQLAQFFGVPTGTGLLISSVADNSPAAMAGLKAGDVIVRANLKPMETMGHWAKVIREAKGRPITVDYVRDRQQKTVTLTPDIKRKISYDLPTPCRPSLPLASLTEL